MSAGHADRVLRQLRQVVAKVAQVADRGLTDRELLRQFAAQQDETAFSLLVRRHGPMVLRVGQSILHHRQDAEDVAQACFLILARKAPSGHWRESVTPWLHRVAYQLALKTRAAAKRRPHSTRLTDSGRGWGRGSLEPRAPDPLAEITLREAEALVHEELNRLPEKYRAPFVLWHLEGKTQDETARLLGWSKATTRRRLEQGRNLLRTRLVRRGFTLGAATTTLIMTPNAASAALPMALVAGTVKAAVLIGQGKPLLGTVSAQVVWLIEKGFKTLLWTKFKIGVVLLSGLTVALAGAGVIYSSVQLTPKPNDQISESPQSAAKEISQSNQPKPKEQPRLDSHGDSLPERALLRLGTIRFRHPNGAGALAISPDGKLLATEGSGTIRVWDSCNGMQFHCFPFQRRMGGSFAGQQLITFSRDSKQLLAAGDEGKVFIWDLKSGEQQKITLGNLGTVHSVSLSPDGQLLAAGAEFGAVVRDQSSGQILFRINSQPPGGLGGIGPSDRLFLHGRYTLALFSPDGKSIAVNDGSPPQHIRLCDSKSGGEIRRIDLKAKLVRMAFSPDGRHIAVTERDNAVRVYETATGRRIQNWMVKLDNPIESYTSVLAFSTDGKSVAAGATDNLIRLWDVATGREIRIFRGHSWYITGLAFDPQRAVLCSASWDGTVRRWDVATGKELVAADGYASGVAVAFAPDGKHLATSSDAPVHLWDTATGRRLRVLEGDPLGTTYQSYSSDGRILAAGGAGPSVYLWDGATGNPLRHWSWPKGKDPYTSVDHLAFSRDNRLFATVVYRANQVLVWDVATGLQKLSLSHEMPRGVAFSPDGKTLVTCGWDKAVILWDLPSGQVRECYWLPGDTDFREKTYRDPRIESLSLSPDGRYLATSQLDGSVCLWYLPLGKVIHQFRPLTKVQGDQGRLLTFSPDGLWLACLGNDNTILIVDPHTGQVALHLRGHQGRVDDLAFSPDGRTLLSGSRDSTALLWTLRPTEASRAASAAGSRTPDLQTLWNDLSTLSPGGRGAGGEGATADAAAAYRAVWRMADMPKEAVEFLSERVKPAQGLSEQTTRPLIADLDHDSFERREQAMKKLRDLGPSAEPAIRTALEARPSSEQKHRLEDLLRQLGFKPGSLSDDIIRPLRAVAVLQRINTPESRQVLERLATGSPSALPTQQAKVALRQTMSHPMP